MGNKNTPWILQASTRWVHFRQVPLKRLWVLLVAAFLLFSVIGFYVDLVQTKGQIPYAAAFAIAAFSGLNAVLWIFVLARLSRIWVVGLIVLQFFTAPISTFIAYWVINTLKLNPIPSDTGINFAATAIMGLVIASYIFFVTYIRRAGLETYKLANELELAHGIQKTLVPPVSLRSKCFEVYGISFPSEKVGGDLVDAVFLPTGDAVAYLADISGHGLQAGARSSSSMNCPKLRMARSNALSCGLAQPNRCGRRCWMRGSASRAARCRYCWTASIRCFRR